MQIIETHELREGITVGFDDVIFVGIGKTEETNTKAENGGQE